MHSLVEVQGLCKTFPNADHPALAKITASIPKGEMVGLVGPDGSGKTTLIRLMAALLLPSQGTISIQGKDTVKDAEAIHLLTGYMPQRFGLYDELTVLQNLNLYFDLQGGDVQEKEATFNKLLRFTRLKDFSDRQAKDLSGGMRQKLGLACALLRKPVLLLLDEPSVGVDPLSRRELWTMVHDLIHEGISVIWSTAYLEEAGKCDKILLMREGTLLFYGNPREMIEPMEGRTYLFKSLGMHRRAKVKEVLQAKEVVDVVIQGEDLRIVFRSTEEAMHWKALQTMDTNCEKTAPRLEDAFINILGGSSKEVSKFTSLSMISNSSKDVFIDIEDLTKTFGSFTAVDHISCQIYRGEVFGLLGPNGAGKSTTFKMLSGLLMPTSGKAFVGGLNLRTSPAEVRRHIGYMAQKFSLYGQISVLENLEFFAGIYGLEGEKKQTMIQERVEMFALTPYLSTSAEMLPLGYKQRLSLACATLHNPEILFLDEPTSGVDPLIRREFWGHINALVEKGVTIMVTTHFMDEAEYCDRIALIYQGKMIHVDSPDALKKLAQTTANPSPTLEEAFIHLIEEYDNATSSHL
jgi:ABC-2 type transport system ATP-binding protein